MPYKYFQLSVKRGIEMINSLKLLFTHETTKLVFLVLLIILLSFGVGVKVLNYESNKNAESWLNGDIKRFSQNKDIVFSSKFIKIEDKLKNRLQEQYDNIRNRAKTHQTIMIYYTSRYYMAITMASITGIIATLMMIIISKNGWESTNSYIITIFLTMSGLTAYFAAFPTLFEHEKNIEENKLLYAVYLNLEDRTLSYAVTKEDINKKSKELNIFIHDIDAELSKYNKLPIKLNSSGIKDISNSLNNQVQ